MSASPRAGPLREADDHPDPRRTAARRHESRLAGWASEQSSVIASRDELEERVRAVKERYGNDVPLPNRWGGFRLRAETIEFWQHGLHRLHDRLRYARAGDGWKLER